MHKHSTYQIIELGLSAVEGAWSPVSREISRIAEGDDELHAAWSQIDSGFAELSRTIRARLRASRGVQP